jgi:hypothetical protein
MNLRTGRLWFVEGALSFDLTKGESNVSDLFAFIGGPLVMFYSIAAIASILLVVQLLLTALGFGDADVVDDFDVDSTNVISFRSLTGFFGGFGWAGVVLLENDFSLTVAILGGLVVGGGFMMSFAYLMRIFYSLRESGNIDLRNAIGHVGTVYVSIPPSGSGSGQVRVMVQGRLQVLEATTTAADRIPSEHRVRITEVVDAATLMVEPVGDHEAKET